MRQRLWEIRKSKIAASPNFYRFDHKQSAAANTIPALIQCLPTGKPAASPAGNADVPAPGRRTDPVPQPPRVNPPPTISTLKVEAAPIKDIERVGNWMCPTKLRLNGRIDVIRPFSGASIFVSTEWLRQDRHKTSRRKRTQCHRSIFDELEQNWSRKLIGKQSDTQSPDVNVKFNVADAAGKLLKTASKTVSMSLQKADPRCGRSSCWRRDGQLMVEFHLATHPGDCQTVYQTFARRR